MPTLLAGWRHDHAMPPECALRLGALLPRTRVHFGPGSHDWFITRPDAFTRVRLGFVQAEQGG